jgi:hypothetical protein
LETKIKKLSLNINLLFKLNLFPFLKSICFCLKTKTLYSNLSLILRLKGRGGGIMKAEFEVYEEGIVDQVVAIASAVIIIGMITMIGVAIMASTATTAQTSVNTLPTAIQTDANAAIATSFDTVSTVSGYYPLLFLAVIGGLAVAAFLGYMYVRGRGGAGGAM